MPKRREREACEISTRTVLGHSFSLLDPDALGRLSTELAEQWYAWSLMWPPWISIVVLPSTGPPLYFIRDGVWSADLVPLPSLPAINKEDLPLDVLSLGESFSFIGLLVSGDWVWEARDQSGDYHRI